MSDDRFDEQRLSELWRVYLATESAVELLEYIQRHEPSLLPCDHKYPQLHRIQDVRLCGQGFRVSRCIQCGERLFFRPMPVTFTAEPGVPFWFSGAALRRWAAEDYDVGSSSEDYWRLLAAKYDGEAGIPILAKLLTQHSEPGIRAVAAHAIAGLPASKDVRLKHIGLALNDTDEWVRDLVQAYFERVNQE